MRHCCGSNETPDSSLFIEMYKLVSTYSLVKPAKGSNISGGEIVQMLLDLKDLPSEGEKRDEWNKKIEDILTKKTDSEVITEALEYAIDHNYHEGSTSDFVLSYVSGFVARRGEKFAKFDKNADGKKVVCKACAATLNLSEKDPIPESYKLIHMRTKGFLKSPSIKLLNLITKLEEATLSVVSNSEISPETIHDITMAIDNVLPLPLVGCEKHNLSLTTSIVAYFLTTRMHFITTQVNKNDNIEREKVKLNRKLSKLVSSTAADNNTDQSNTATDNNTDQSNGATNTVQSKKEKKKKSPVKKRKNSSGNTNEKSKKNVSKKLKQAVKKNCKSSNNESPLSKKKIIRKQTIVRKRKISKSNISDNESSNKNPKKRECLTEITNTLSFANTIPVFSTNENVYEETVIATEL